MPKGSVSAYVASKVWKVSQHTVEKWILTGQIKGSTDKHRGIIIRYWVKETELERLKKHLAKPRQKGKRLLED